MPTGISSRVLQYNKDIQKREGYIADLKTENSDSGL